MGKNPKSLDFTNLNPSILNDASRSLGRVSKIIYIPRNNIEANPINEKYYPEDEIRALAIDIVARGIQNACIVYALENDKYRLLSGHRRWAAANMAAEEMGCVDAELIPCTIRPAPNTNNDEREETIKNNLQREKSDYSKMMEIVDYKASKEERKTQGENIVNVRDAVCEELGVTNAEIYRYEKIYDDLCDTLMEAFRGQLLSTNVAYEIARLDADTQAYIHETWPRTGRLTLPMLNILVSEYKRKTQPPAAAKTPPPPIPTSVEDGVRMISEMTGSILSAIKGQNKIPPKTEQKLLQRLAHQAAALATLKSELARMGIVEATPE